MQIRVMGLGLFCALSLGFGCGGGKTDDAKVDDKAGVNADEKADEKSGAPTEDEPSAQTGAPEPAGETGGGAEAGGTGGVEDPAETGAAAEPELSPEEQLEALLGEVAAKKTKDERALEALEQAKGLEAKPRDLAKAANKRGEKLLVDPDRATKFFEWAQEVDPKYPNATFNLAKLAANTGDIPRVKELLAEVKKRGGKKLLQQIEFDPSFALVADDPEVLALLK